MATLKSIGMPAKVPAIPTPNKLDLKPIQVAIDAVRERLQNVEAVANRLNQLAAAGASAQTLQLLQQQVAQLINTVSALGSAAGVEPFQLEVDGGARAKIHALRRRIENIEMGPL